MSQHASSPSFYGGAGKLKLKDPATTDTNDEHSVGAIFLVEFTKEGDEYSLATDVLRYPDDDSLKLAEDTGSVNFDIATTYVN
jgi:hypothetical protein